VKNTIANIEGIDNRMTNMKEVITKSLEEKKAYIFEVVIEDDYFDDGRKAYHVYCPVLEEYSAVTWGYTKKEAIKNIQEVIQMIIEELIEDGKPIPETPQDELQNLSEAILMVNI
jgi:predicted RNase H-like HicB family nuclease